MERALLASHLDHTLLSPKASEDEVNHACNEARKHEFASVCVNGCWVRHVADRLAGSPVMPICIVGFPLGAMATTAKAAEARQAVADGAMEVDMVINVGWLKSGKLDLVREDIKAVVGATVRPVKVILETSLLTDDEKRIACRLAKKAGAAIVQTSTGFGGGGATVEDIALMCEVVGPEMGVKASGGIRTTQDALRMIEAGATRIGASASVAIVNGAIGATDY